MCSVSRQVDEYVDPIYPDALGKRFIGNAARQEPVIDVVAVASRHSIFPCQFGVSEQLNGRLVVIRKQGLEKVTDRMLIEIRGNVAHSQAPRRVRIINVRTPSASLRNAEAFSYAR